MHGWNSDNRERFHRRMRAFGRMMERDMREMGERVGREAAARHPHAAWDWDWSPGEERAERRAERAERRAEWYAARAERRAERRAMRCGPGGAWAYWWVVFPLFFVGKNAFEDAGGFAGLSNGIENFWGWSLQLTFIAPLAELIAGSLHMSYGQAYALLALSAVICAGAALIGWRMGRPQAASKPV
jgi:hypothetical protein